MIRLKQTSRTSRAALTATLVCGLLAFGAVGWVVTAQQGPPRVRLNRLIEMLEKKQVVIGTFPGRGANAAAARNLALSNNHFAMFDLQYGTFDVADIQNWLLGMSDKAAILRKGSLQPDVVPLVRIPVAVHGAPQYAVTQLLDLGVFGIMFPDIETKEQAANAVSTMRYPQRNTVAMGGPSAVPRPTAAAWYWGVPEPEYVERADAWPLDPNGELLTIIQIETPAGVKNASEIMDVPGVSVIFLGPGDLSRSLGESSTKGPMTEAGVQSVLKLCLARNIACGYPVVEGSPEAAEKERLRRESQGFRMLTVSVTGTYPGR